MPVINRSTLPFASALLALAATGAAPAQSPSWPQLPVAPKGAPNVVVILLDDVGFGATSVFGGR